MKGLTLFFLALSLLLIGLGLRGGGWQDTMGKANFICYECIGVG